MSIEIPKDRDFERPDLTQSFTQTHWVRPEMDHTPQTAIKVWSSVTTVVYADQAVDQSRVYPSER